MIDSRVQLKLLIKRLIKHLFCILCAQKIEPISIKIDADQEKFPDIIETVKDPRNDLNSEYLIKNKERIFLTPNFLSLFDFNHAYDPALLENKVMYNSLQLGFLA